MLKVTKIFRFESAHSLPKHKGACKNLHGHSYKLEVTVKSLTLTDGMVMDFKDLSIIVDKYIIDIFDHKHINEEVDIKNPTAEYMLLWMWNELQKHLPVKIMLSKLKLWETERCFAEYDGIRPI